MTGRKTSFAIKKIELALNSGFILEALLLNYHLNINLLKLICTHSELTGFSPEKKIKNIINKLYIEID